MNCASLLLPVCGLLLTAGISRAVMVTYTINASQSSLTIGGNASGNPLTPQVAGADVVSYSGTITGDLTGGILTLSGGSVLLAASNSAGPFTPALTGSAVDNYGVYIAGIPAAGAIAFRNVQFDLPSGTIASGSPSSAPFQFSTGFADYNIPSIGAPGTLPLPPASSPNTAAGAASISVAGLTETLTLPVALSYAAGGGVTITFNGTITATRAVPEPAAPLLGLLSLAAVAAVRRRG